MRRLGARKTGREIFPLANISRFALYFIFILKAGNDSEGKNVSIDHLLKQQGAWLRGEGPESDIVISSRVRLARNLDGYPFISRMSEVDRKNVVEAFRNAAEKILPSGSYFFLSLPELPEIDRRYLLERQLISPEFVENGEVRAAIVDRNEDFSIMANEEDHLRIQAMNAGFDFDTVWGRVNKLDDEFEKELSFAFNEKRGYLTACPSNLGTGLRASVMLHLPGLVETGEIERLTRSMQKINLAVRGMYGEGSRALGDFYQLSNQMTLGMAEEELIAHLEGIIPRVIEYERKSREHLMETEKEKLLDRTFRGIGILARARKIDVVEAMEHLSSARLGAHLGLQQEISVGKINDLLLHIQPAHLEKIAGREFADESEDIFRAEYLRERLA